MRKTQATQWSPLLPRFISDVTALFVFSVCVSWTYRGSWRRGWPPCAVFTHSLQLHFSSGWTPCFHALATQPNFRHTETHFCLMINVTYRHSFAFRWVYEDALPHQQRWFFLYLPPSPQYEYRLNDEEKYIYQSYIHICIDQVFHRLWKLDLSPDEEKPASSNVFFVCELLDQAYKFKLNLKAWRRVVIPTNTEQAIEVVCLHLRGLDPSHPVAVQEEVGLLWAPVGFSHLRRIKDTVRLLSTISVVECWISSSTQ